MRLDVTPRLKLLRLGPAYYRAVAFGYRSGRGVGSGSGSTGWLGGGRRLCRYQGRLTGRTAGGCR